MNSFNDPWDNLTRYTWSLTGENVSDKILEAKMLPNLILKSTL